MAKYQVFVKLYADIFLDAEDFNDAMKKAEDYVGKEFYKWSKPVDVAVDRVDWVDGETIGVFKNDA